MNRQVYATPGAEHRHQEGVLAEAAPGPSTVPEQGKSQALFSKPALTTFKVAIGPKAYPEVKLSIEQVGMVEAALLDSILSSEDAETPRFNVIYQDKRDAIALLCLRDPYRERWSGEKAQLSSNINSVGRR